MAWQYRVIDHMVEHPRQPGSTTSSLRDFANSLDGRGSCQDTSGHNGSLNAERRNARKPLSVSKSERPWR